MLLDIEEINYDFLKSNNSFIITYRNEEFVDLAAKIEILQTFQDIVLRNNGCIVGKKDDFENEEDVILAIEELKEYLKEEQTQEKIFKEFIINFTNINGEIDFYLLNNFLFMLEEDVVKKILEIK